MTIQTATSAMRNSKHSKRGSIWTYIFLVAAVLLLLGAWQRAGDRHTTVRLLVSTPIATLHYLTNHLQSLGLATTTTGLESLAGLLIAATLSIGCMVLCLLWPTLFRIALPTMVGIQVVPLITLAPFFVMAFGVGVKSKIAMTTLMCFFPIFITFARAVASTPPEISELLFVYDTPRWFRVRRVFVPMAQGGIFAGARVSATLAVIGAIVAEFNGAEQGLGKNLFLSARRLEPELMICSLVASTALAAALYWSTTLVESLIGAWYLSSANSE